MAERSTESVSDNSHCSITVKEKQSSCCAIPSDSASDKQSQTENSSCSISCDCEIKAIKSEQTLVLVPQTQLNIPDFPIQFEIKLADSSCFLDVVPKHPPDIPEPTPIYKKIAVFLI